MELLSDISAGFVRLRFCKCWLTPSLPWCHLKTTNKRAKFETLKHFCFLFSPGQVCQKGFSSKRIALKIAVIGPEIYCLQARLYIIQPGNLQAEAMKGLNVF